MATARNSGLKRLFLKYDLAELDIRSSEALFVVYFNMIMSFGMLIFGVAFLGATKSDTNTTVSQIVFYLIDFLSTISLILAMQEFKVSIIEAGVLLSIESLTFFSIIVYIRTINRFHSFIFVVFTVFMSADLISTLFIYLFYIYKVIRKTSNSILEN